MEKDKDICPYQHSLVGLMVYFALLISIIFESHFWPAWQPRRFIHILALHTSTGDDLCCEILTICKR